MDAKLCGRCHQNPRAISHNWCLPCHAAEMREYRRTHVLTGLELLKARCRAYTNVLVHRGVLKRTPCATCGHRRVQAHHPDYRKPRRVVWLCRDCHGKIHGHRPRGRDVAVP